MSNTFNMFTPPKKLKRKKNLVEFRAGKMKLQKNNWVYPDKRKGTVFIHRSLDGMMHFCWKDRSSDEIEDDFIVFPHETIFQPIPECTTGRVYLLKFRDSKKMFIWMQEPKEEKDAELCKQVNEILNQKRVEGSTNGSKDLNISEFTNLLGQLNEIGALNEIDLMEILGLTHEFESHQTSESGMSNIYGLNTNPFQIGSNFSAGTFAERELHAGTSKDTFRPIKDNNLNPHSTRIDVSSLNSQNTNQPNIIVDPNSVFSEHTLRHLSRNRVFKSKILSIDDSERVIEVDISSEQFKTCIKNFGIILADSSMSEALLREMGLPENIINKAREHDVSDLINKLEEYYGNKKNDWS